MLTLYHNGGEYPLDTTEYYVRELASGLDEVIFDISIWDPMYAFMAEEENIVDRGGQRYLIKQIDAGAVTAKVVCQLDLDEWRASMAVGYDSGTKTVVQQIEAVKPAGWSVLDYSHVSIGRTIKGDLTPLQVCEECRDIYQVYIRWDTKTKTCMIYKQALGTPVGSFASRQLNLKEINYKGTSNNFATRLYAYGKDGLSFASINDGKPYVDNNTYSSRVICAYWQDDRYTVAANLLADAQEKLAKLAVPERSYDCAIVDLQATNPELYNNLDFSLFTTATLIDDIKETAVDYMVVERHVWPYHPDRNDVIFNSSPVKIQNTVVQIEDEITNPNSTFQQQWAARIDEATDWLTNGDGYVVARQDADGNWKALLFMDTPDIATAQKVIQINENGIGFSTTGVNGPYTNAWTIDGKLNADFILTGTMVADRIRGGILQSNDSVNDPNFILNLATGVLQAKKFSIDTTNFKLTNTGVLTSISSDEKDRTVIDKGNMRQVYIVGSTHGRYYGSDIVYGGDGLYFYDIYDYENDIKYNCGTIRAFTDVNTYALELLGKNGDGTDSGTAVIVSNTGASITGLHGNVRVNNSSGETQVVGQDVNIVVDNDLYINGNAGANGGFYDANGNYVTVEHGIITSL